MDKTQSEETGNKQLRLVGKWIVAVIVVGVIYQQASALGVSVGSLDFALWIVIALCGLRALNFALVGCWEHTDNRHIFDNLRAIWWTLATILIVLIRIAYKLS